MKSVKEQIRRIRVIRDRFWTWRRSRRRKSTVRRRRRRSTLRFAWKAIPSEARVTRDEVSGIKKVGKSCLEDSTTKTCYFSCLSTSKIDKRWKKNESSEWIVSPFCWFLTVVNTFSALFQEKYFLSFVIPPFHLSVATILIVNALCAVELVVELGWNYMKFHP